VEQGRLVDRWRLRRAGKLVFAETVRLDGDITAKLARPVCAKGASAAATLLIAPGDDGVAATVRALTHVGEVGVSAWSGLALVRFAARDGAALRHDIVNVLAALNCAALPRLWLS
jgi:urease accessory protein